MKLRSILYYFMLVAALLCTACNVGAPDPDDVETDDPDQLSEYITHVFEYVYAPGQHARLAAPESGDNFIGEPYHDVFLGGFGGYVIAGFDHNVLNVKDESDFEIFCAGVAPEPAVVYVMSDTNGNGLPDDSPWYELKGSEFNNPETIRDYSITYYKAKYAESNITWKDNRQNTGELTSSYNAQSSSGWWWSAASADSITFTGTRLPDAYVNNVAEGQYWIVPDSLFKWGYAENNKGDDYSKENRSNRFDISNAVDKAGNPVDLPHIRFIKVQTGVFQQAGWLNEISSEVQGAKDLHFGME